MAHHFEDSTKNIGLNDFNDGDSLFDDIKFKQIRFEETENNQIEFRSKLSSVKMGSNKSKKQLREIEIIANFYKS